jgi:membrane protein YdbS with pleckstrin-like domain
MLNVMIDDDKPLMNLSRSRKAFSIEYICATFLLSLPLIAIWKGVSLTPFYSIVPLGVAGTVIGMSELSRYVHRSNITENKILIVDGLVKMRKRHVFISAINDVDTKQTRLQRLLGFGNVHVRTASGEELELRDINNPERVMEKIEELIAK